MLSVNKDFGMEDDRRDISTRSFLLELLKVMSIRDKEKSYSFSGSRGFQTARHV